jgi:uncharacterized protein
MRPAAKLSLAVLLAIGLLFAGLRLRDAHREVDQAPAAGSSAEAPAPVPGAASGEPPASEQVAAEEAPPRDELDDFTSVLLAEAADTWTPIFAEESDTYIPPRLSFFDGTTRSGCGNDVETDGTFYCAPDRRLYIDKDFHHGMVDRGAPLGSLAHGYVLAHAVGHHVQALRGTEEKLRKQEEKLGARDRKGLQTRAELQADCFAGIWAHNARSGKRALTNADIDQALSLPASIGIELMQRHQPGVIVPDPYSHGTLPQRKRWFLAGYKHGLVKDCDTFSARRL